MTQLSLRLHPFLVWTSFVTVELNFRIVELQLAHMWTIARTSGTNVSQNVIVELTDSDGILGLGEAAPTLRYGESAETVSAFLSKVNPTRISSSDINASMRYLDTLSVADFSAKCALNMALLDMAGKRSGKAIYDLLGLGFREQQHVTSFTIGIDTPEVIHKKVLAAASYPVLKMKVGSSDDKANLKALRDAAPQKPVRVDANEGWKTKEQALAMMEWLAQDCLIQYVEQPLPANAPAADWAWLKARSPLPVFGDESYHHASDAAQAAECFHGINVKLVKTGGISGGFEALAAARKAGLKTMIGCMIETSVLISAAAQLAELCDYLDVDGNILITNDPYEGVSARAGVVSFAEARERHGLRVHTRSEITSGI